MTEYIMSIDPGVSTGIALIRYRPGKPPTLEGAWQFTGGVAALKDWTNWYWDGRTWDCYNDSPNTRGFYSYEIGVGWPLSVDSERGLPATTTVICEKFTARATKGFSYTTASLEPLRGEGLLIGLDIMPDYHVSVKQWRDPSVQYLVGGRDLADKKKRQHEFLKDIGFYRTNKDFPDSPSKDGADDFRSAAAHGLAYLARVVKHKPTYDMVSTWASTKGVQTR